MVTAELGTVDSTTYEKKDPAPGKCVIAKTKGLGGGVTTEEMYQAPGLVSRPPKGARHVRVPVGNGRKCIVSIACKNYAVDVEVVEGETTIFSTTADGKTVKARVDLKADGTISVNNEKGKIDLGADGKTIIKSDSQNLAKLMADLIDTISGLATCGSPGSHRVRATSKLKFTQLKTKFAELLKEP